jgi:hypothetical protein
MINLNVPYLKDSYIASVADFFLKQNHVISIPVNIEYVIESNYRMDIVPLPSLKMAFDIDGFSTSDFNAICVDQFVYEQRYHRFRFTLAHELGHRVLHQEYLSKHKFSSIAEWKNVVDQLNPSDHSKMEYQSNVFAGQVLVPKEFLRVEFKEQLRILEPQIEQARSSGLSRDDYVHTVLYEIANGLSPKFDVSVDVLTRRIEFESLEQEIR